MASAAAAAVVEDARRLAAAARLRLAWRIVRAVEVLALVVLLSRSLPLLPVAADAASSVLRLAASLLLHPYSIFLLANGIVVLLLALSRQSFADDDAHDQFLSFATAPLAPLAPITEAAAPPPPEEGAVFEDKQAVHVTARAPRRSRSEKAGRGKRTRAASPELRRSESPELRRSESERGRRRRSLSSASPGDWPGVEDDHEEEEDFRRAVEAFIAKQQTRFHREESFVLVGGAAGDEKRTPERSGAAAAPAAVKRSEVS